MDVSDLLKKINECEDPEEVIKLMEQLKVVDIPPRPEIDDAQLQEPDLGDDLKKMHANIDGIVESCQNFVDVNEKYDGRLDELMEEYRQLTAEYFSLYDQRIQLLYTAKLKIKKTEEELIPEIPDLTGVRNVREFKEVVTKFGKEMEATEAGFQAAVKKVDWKETDEYKELTAKMVKTQARMDKILAEENAIHEIYDKAMAEIEIE